MLKKYISTLASWLTVLLITIGLLEIALRLFDQVPVHKNPLSGFQVADPDLGWIGKPLYQGRFRGRDYDVIVAHDERGFRVTGDTTTAADDATPMIAFLGDSFTWGWGVEGDEIFTNRLQALAGSDLAVRNFGVNAFGTAQQLLLFDKHVSAEKPDTVVLMFFSNDLNENLDDKEGRRPWFELVDGKLEPRNQPVARVSVGAFKRLTQNSVAISTLKFAYYQIKRSLESNDERDAAVPLATVPEENWAVTAALLGEFATRCAQLELGCEFRVVYIPTREEVLALQSGEQSPIATRLRQVCEEQGIAFLDLRPGLVEALESEPASGPDATPIYFPFDGHWDTPGHQAAAELILNQWNRFEFAR